MVAVLPLEEGLEIVEDISVTMMVEVSCCCSVMLLLLGEYSGDDRL